MNSKVWHGKKLEAIEAENAKLQNEIYLQKLRNESRQSATRETVNPGYPGPRYASTDQNLIKHPSERFPDRRAETYNQFTNYDFNRPASFPSTQGTLPTRDKFVQPPRLAQQNGMRHYQTSIPSAKKDTNVQVGSEAKDPTLLAENEIHAEKVSRFMFFMLMFSLGLNLYLAWIARGFYFRYNELADELRETFTSSNNL